MKKDDGQKYHWHKWFAWYPILINGNFIWLKFVERRITLYVQNIDPSSCFEGWEYRKL